jgi:hypothetical protein
MNKYKCSLCEFSSIIEEKNYHINKIECSKYKLLFWADVIVSNCEYYQSKTENMNSTIYNRVLSSNIPMKDKLKALEDIKVMESSKLHGEHCVFDFDEPCLYKAFAFNKSILGFEFWIKISNLIDIEYD